MNSTKKEIINVPKVTSKNIKTKRKIISNNKKPKR